MLFFHGYFTPRQFDTLFLFFIYVFFNEKWKFICVDGKKGQEINFMTKHKEITQTYQLLLQLSSRMDKSEKKDIISPVYMILYQGKTYRYLIRITYWRNQSFSVDKISGTLTNEFRVYVLISWPHLSQNLRPSYWFWSNLDISYDICYFERGMKEDIYISFIMKSSLRGILWDFFIFTLEQIIVLNKYCT